MNFNRLLDQPYWLEIDFHVNQLFQDKNELIFPTVSGAMTPWLYEMVNALVQSKVPSQNVKTGILMNRAEFKEEIQEKILEVKNIICDISFPDLSRMIGEYNLGLHNRCKNFRERVFSVNDLEIIYQFIKLADTHLSLERVNKLEPNMMTENFLFQCMRSFNEVVDKRQSVDRI